MSDVRERHARPESRRSAYCPCCNGRYFVSPEAAGCPQCGLSAAATPSIPLDATAVMPTGTLGAADGPGEQADAFDGRLGRLLHVYEFDSLLGAGGMGRVYLARHNRLGRRCAVKVLSPRAIDADFDYVRRFQEEGEAAALLNHPNIVVTHAIGEERGFHFLEMEYVAGGSLRQVLQDEAPLPPLRATNLAFRVAEGLACAHRHGIIHRDLKPDNVMLTLSGVPKITDFGLAKRVRGDDPLERRRIAGTPHYMAPELFDGDAASPASDVYALGVTYFVLLTGRLPFIAGSLGALRKTVLHDPLPNARLLAPDLPLEMAECLAMLLEKCPANRPSNAIAAAQLLSAVAGEVPDIETLLVEAFSGRPDVTWTHAGERYVVRLTFRDGRKQDVSVEPGVRGTAEKLLVISSVCGPADPTFYEPALRLNAEMSHGSLTVCDLDGVPMFCATNTYPRETADAEEIRRSVLELAHRADALELLLTGQDRY